MADSGDLLIGTLFFVPKKGYQDEDLPSTETIRRRLNEMGYSIISLHCPLTEDNHYLINEKTIAQMKPGMMLINTSRGPLIDTKAVIKGIKSGQIGHLGIDVYEEEDDIFFKDLSDTIIQDDTFQLLQSFPNVLITSHQAYFTDDAMNDITTTTVANITDFEQGNPLTNAVKPPEKVAATA